MRRVRLRSFHRRIGSPLVFCNVWLLMCAYSYALVASVVADRNVMTASRLLAAEAARVILLSFAAGHCKLQWSGCIKVATVISQRFFAILPLAFFLLKKSFLKCFKIVFFLGLASRSGFGPEDSAVIMNKKASLCKQFFV